MPSVVNDGDVDIEDIAVFEDSFAGDAVADNVIDRGANRFGIALIVEGCGDSPVLGDELVALSIDVFGGGIRLNERRDIVETSRTESTCLCHVLEVLGLVDRDMSGRHVTGE